jgi:hypothetical protein
MRKLDIRGVSHIILPLVAVVAVGLIGTLAIVASHAASCGPAGAWSSSATNGQTNNGGYFFDNNEYGHVSGSSQTIWVSSPTSWGICTNQPNPPASVKGYAEEQKTVNQPISSYADMTDTVSFNVPSKGTFNADDDLWLNGTPGKAGAIEVMIWPYTQYQRPAGTDEGNITVGTQKYVFWEKTGSNPTYTFQYQTNAKSTTMHMLSAFKYLANTKHLISLSDTFSQFNFGYEVVGTGTNPTTEDFTTTNFSLNLAK